MYFNIGYYLNALIIIRQLTWCEFRYILGEQRKIYESGI